MAATLAAPGPAHGRAGYAQSPGAQHRLSGEVIIGGTGDAAAALTAAKQALRRRILAARAELTEQQRAEAGRRLRDALLAMPQAQMAGTVAAYYSVGTEPPTRSLVYALWKRGTYVLLPRSRPGGKLGWASFEGPESMAPASHGLLEPAQPATAAITSADLVIVPALAADRRGNRLGRGRGYYDRALPLVGQLIPTIAMLYDGELLDELPAGPLDHPVRMAAQPATGVTLVG